MNTPRKKWYLQVRWLNVALVLAYVILLWAVWSSIGAICFLVTATLLGSFLLNFFDHQRGVPPTRYQEICDIKDRLYRDMVRLAELQGWGMASENIKRIMTDARL